MKRALQPAALRIEVTTKAKRRWIANVSLIAERPSGESQGRFPTRGRQKQHDMFPSASDLRDR